MLFHALDSMFCQSYRIRENVCGGKLSRFEWKIAIRGKIFVVVVVLQTCITDRKGHNFREKIRTSENRKSFPPQMFSRIYGMPRSENRACMLMIVGFRNLYYAVCAQMTVTVKLSNKLAVRGFETIFLKHEAGIQLALINSVILKIVSDVTFEIFVNKTPSPFYLIPENDSKITCYLYLLSLIEY